MLSALIAPAYADSFLSVRWKQVFVDKLHWISTTVFLELLALCQFLPGPTSTQLSFALGITQKGVTGGLFSGALFQYPGLILSAIVGVGAANYLKNPRPWLLGLTAGGLAPAGVALVASAAKSLTYKTCNDKVTMAINAGVVVITYYYHPGWIFPVLLVIGGIITLIQNRKKTITSSDEDVVDKLGVNRVVGVGLIATWLILLIVSVVVRAKTAYATHRVFHWWEAFFRIGSLIWGGGQVVLPMLDNAIVAPGWISPLDFYTGLALIQAFPGPLFNLSAYLGAIIAHNAGVFELVGIIVCWVGLFAPGVLLVFGVLPLWAMFRHWQVYRRALPGINSAAVGLIVVAVFQLGLKIIDQSPFPIATLSIGIIAFGLTDIFDVPAPLVVLAGGVLGIIGWVCGMH